MNDLMLARDLSLADALEVLVKSVLALYIVVNPASVSSVYLGLTRELDKRERIRVALVAVSSGAVVLTAFAWLGSFLFSWFRVTAGSLQIAGGILLFGFAFALIRGREREFFGASAAAPVAERPSAVALYPLAVPLIAGPASITVVTTMSADAQAPIQRVALFATIAIVATLCFASMMRVGRLHDRLGPGLALVAPRVMGLVLAVIAVQLVIDGVAEVLPRLAETLR